MAIRSNDLMAAAEEEDEGKEGEEEEEEGEAERPEQEEEEEEEPEEASWRKPRGSQESCKQRPDLTTNHGWKAKSAQQGS